MNGPPQRPEVKICGLRRRSDVFAAVGAGASYLGFVFAESPRRVQPEDVLFLATGVEAEPVGVFVDRPVHDVVSTAGRAGVRTVQLHGEETPEACEILREGGLTVWKAIRPRSREELHAQADRYRGAVDALLVEGYAEDAAGGAGAEFPHRWLLDREGRRLPGRLVLAGGLTPRNVGSAVRTVGPDVVDVSSGVESAPGEKDPRLVRAFVRAALMAAEAPSGGSSAEEAHAEEGRDGG